MRKSERNGRRHSSPLALSWLLLTTSPGLGHQRHQLLPGSSAFNVRAVPTSAGRNSHRGFTQSRGAVTPHRWNPAGDRDRCVKSIRDTLGARFKVPGVVVASAVSEDVEGRKRSACSRRRIRVPSGITAVGRSSPTSSYESSGHALDDGGSGGGKYRLMLVDDEEALRRAVSEYLEQRGYRVAAHASAGEALQSLRDQNAGAPPDLIITDVNMSGMNGFRFLEALRSGGRRERSIPVVFLTARGLTTDRIEGYRAGVNAYLSKPFDPEELVSIVDSVLFNHAKMAEEAAAEAAEAAKKQAMEEAAQLVSVERRGDQSSEEAGAEDGGTGSEVLEDVRRELGDIKALLLADRAQRRGSGGGGGASNGALSGRGRLDNLGPRLLTTSSSKDKSADPVRSLGSPLREGTAGERAARVWEGFLGDAIEMPPVLLSGRERTVLSMVLKGYTNREIAQVLDLSVRSVEKYVSNMLAKTGTTNRTELVRYSLRENLVPEDDG